MRRRYLFLVLNAAGVVALGLPGAPAYAAAGDNFVQAQAWADHAVDERSNVMVVTNSASRVDNGNLAEAYSHDCTGCRSVAVAFQVVLIPGSPSTVSPGNLASASNVSCTRCDAIAFAKQYIVYSHGATRIDRDAQKEVANISAKVRAIATSGATADAMDSQLTPLFDKLVSTVRDGLENSRHGDAVCGSSKRDEA